MDNVECPFCGLWFEPYAHPNGTEYCPLQSYSFTRNDWGKRPPKKEQPAMPAVESEVMFLRKIVERLVVR